MTKFRIVGEVVTDDVSEEVERGDEVEPGEEVEVGVDDFFLAGFVDACRCSILRVLDEGYGDRPECDDDGRYGCMITKKGSSAEWKN